MLWFFLDEIGVVGHYYETLSQVFDIINYTVHVCSYVNKSLNYDEKNNKSSTCAIDRFGQSLFTFTETSWTQRWN